MVVKTAFQLKLPMSLKLVMLLNVAFDFAIGLIPFVGDIIDIAYKCSTRNVIMLERHLRRVGAARLKNDGLDPSTVDDPSLPERYDSEDEEAGNVVQRPDRAQTRPDRRGDAEKVEPSGSEHTRSKSKKDKLQKNNSTRHKNTYR